jgi:hypothetical protein
MSEWIDFAIYVTFIVLIFVLVPRHGRQFTLPMIADRNPQWLADHHDIVVRVERSRWFLHVCYVWAAASIAVLLGVALDLIALPFGAEAPKWEVLKDLNSTLLIVGLLGWGACSLLWFRWLGTHVPLAETRRATLKPRVASDYLAPSWRIGVEALTVLHLGAWVVIGALGWAGGAKFWWSFAFFAGMTVLFAVMAHFVPRRRPDYLDRMFGEAYRQGEIKAVYFMRVWPVAAGAIVMTEHMTGLDLARAAHLLIVSFVSVLALMVLRVRPIVPPSDTTRYDALAGARRSAA